MDPIPPIPPRPDPSGPFWSVVIPTYNRFEYLDKTLESILAQDPGPDQMQIAVVDDCSTIGDPGEVLERMGALPRVELFRLERHVSISDAWNHCIAVARGQWVHIMHSDDVVLPGYYQRLRAAVEADPEVAMAFCRAVWMDQDGNWTALGPLEMRKAGRMSGGAWDQLFVENRVQCPAVVVKRSAYERVGGYRGDLHYALDWEMWQRIALTYPVWYDPQVLFCWRDHAGGETARLMRNNAAMADVRRCIDVVRLELPSNKQYLATKALAACGTTLVWLARGLLANGQYLAAARSLREGFACGLSRPVLAAFTKFVVLAPFLFARSLARLTARSS